MGVRSYGLVMFCFVLFVCFLCCFIVILGKTLYSHISSLYWVETYFLLVRFCLCIDKNGTRQNPDSRAFVFRFHH